MDGMQQLYFGNLALDPNRQRQIVYYGRVSTEHEAQLEALEKQMQWYEDQTRYHPNWTVVGRYIDEGITGTLAKKRPAFMRMIEDAKQRKFDLIVFFYLLYPLANIFLQYGIHIDLHFIFFFLFYNF